MPNSPLSDLAFVRVPKTGSTSLMQSLFPVISETSGEVCLSGVHVPASFYAMHPHPHRLITLVRDPLQMYCSFYWFMKIRLAKKDFKTPLAINPAHLENMALLNSGADLGTFLRECPPNQLFPFYYDTIPVSEYFYVGTVDDMKTSMTLLNRMTGIDTSKSMVASNVNGAKPSSGEYPVSAETRSIFESRNAQEYSMHELALTRYSELKAEYSL